MAELAARNGFSQPVYWTGTGNLSAESAPAPTACGSTERCVLGFDTVADMRLWLLHNPGRAGIAIAFGGSPDSDAGYAGQGSWNNASYEPLADRSQLLYELWHNQSATFYYRGGGLDALQEGFASAELNGRHAGPSALLSAQRMVDDALLASYAPSAASSALSLSARSYPRLRENEGSSIGPLIILFVAISLLVSHVLMVNRIVGERERGVTGAMRAMGLLDTAYWASYWALALASSLLTCAIVYVTGVASNFYLFATVDGGVLYTICLLFSLAMAGSAFVIGSVISRTRTAVLMSVFGLIGGLQLLMVSVNAPVIGYIFWDKPFPGWIRTTLELTIPGINLMKVKSLGGHCGCGHRLLLP
jgi:hypothetical protein